MKNENNKHLVQLGNRMRELRLKAGHTSVERFTDENDFSRVLYSNYESGLGNITHKNLVKVCAALGVTLKEFFSKGFDE